MSSDPQLAPNTAGVSQIVVAGPLPPTDVFFSAPPLQNPTQRPSGEKKGPDAPSVPAIGVAESSIEGPEIQLLPVALDATEHDRPAVGRPGHRRTARTSLGEGPIRGQRLQVFGWRDARRGRAQRPSRLRRRRRPSPPTSVVATIPATRPASARDTRMRRPRRARCATGRCRHAGRGAALVDPPQFARQIARALPSLVGILREAAGDDVVEQRGHQRLELDDGSWRVLENRGDQAGVPLPVNALFPVTIS